MPEFTSRDRTFAPDLRSITLGIMPRLAVSPRRTIFTLQGREFTMGEINVSVSIPDAGSFEKTVRAASRAGLKIKDKLDILGVATGSIEENSLGKLKEISGVDSVEEQRDLGIPHPLR